MFIEFAEESKIPLSLGYELNTLLTKDWQLKHELKMKLRFKIWKQGFDKFNTSK